MKRKVYPDVMEEPVRRGKKKSHTLYALLVLVLGIAILAFSVSILFRIREIRIEGNGYCSEREIRQMVQSDRFSSNALFVFVKYAVGRGEVLPCLEDVKITLKSPWSVKIAVKEKPVVGYLIDGEDYAYFDREGLIVCKGSDVIPDIPRVEGLAVKEAALYKKLESSDSGIFEELLETTRELKKYDMRTKKIVCRNGRIYLYVRKACVSLGNTVSAEKIAQIQPIMKKVKKMKGTLHLENFTEGSATVTFDQGEFPEAEKKKE